MLKLIRFELKKLLNIKTFICFILLLATLFGFSIYNTKQDKKYDGADKIDEYNKERSYYNTACSELIIQAANIRQKKLNERNITRDNPNYDDEFDKVANEFRKTPLAQKIQRDYDFYQQYLNLVATQNTTYSMGNMQYVIEGEIRKNNFILEGIDKGIIKGKAVYKNNNYIIENPNVTKRSIKYNQLLLDKNINFLHSPYQMKGFNFLISAIKTFVPLILPIFIIIIIANSLSYEQEIGSFKFLLLQPFSRKQFYMAKFIASIIVILSLFIICISAVFISTSIVNGIEQSYYPIEYNPNSFLSIKQIENTSSTLHTMSILNYALILTAFSIIYIVFIVCLCIFISAITPNTIDSFIAGLSVLVFSYITTIPTNIPKFLSYFPTMNTNFENIICKTESLTGLSTIILLIIYSLMFFGFGLKIFNKKNIVC